MVTAPPVPRPRPRLHTRADWRAQDDRIPSAVWLGILWLGIAVGFSLDIPGFLSAQPPAPKIIYVHGVIFTVWLCILTAQVFLVLGKRIDWHRKLGWFAAGWAVLMAIFGPWAAMASEASFLHVHFTGQHPPFTYTGFLAVNLVDIAGFLVLLAWGLRLRKNPGAHRRMMILATVSLADPGFARLSAHVLHPAPHSAAWFFLSIFYGNLLLIALMTAWDWWRGRLMRSFLWGASALLACEYAAASLFYWGPWQHLTLVAVQAWARL